MIPPLNSGSIQSFLTKNTRTRINKWVIENQLESTNDTVAHLDIAFGMMNVCLAESQLKGRGRRGNSWIASSNRNVLMSCSWQLTSWSPQVSALSLMLAVGVTQTLKKLNIYSALKWPNDILFQQKKLGGLLIEAVNDSNGSVKLIIGLGLNIDIEQQDAALITQPWIDLKKIVPANTDIDRNFLIASIVSEWLHTLQNFPANCKQILQQWNNHAEYLHQPIQLIDKTSGILKHSGIFTGVSSAGELLIKTEHKTETIMDSNLSLIPLAESQFNS